jgi:SAM-dependent methyltransferase
VDAVSFLDVLEHLDDPQTALLEAHRVLQPDGRLIINVPAHRWLWSPSDVSLGHHRRYTRRMLRKELVAAGFEPELTTHVFSWLVPPVWFVRRLARPSNAELGLDRRSLPIDVASLVLTALERMTIGRVSLPLGTSVLCVARPATR